MLASNIEQTRSDDGAAAGSHPCFNAHTIQGWSPDFIPKLAEDVLLVKNIDEFVVIDGAEAMLNSRRLAQEEGIFAGISGGATLTGALQVCEKAEPGSTILAMLPDTGERYLSTPLFEGIQIDMNEEETSISESTPGFRFKS
jgi:cysteine synthase A